MTLKGIKKRIEYFFKYKNRDKNPVDTLRKNGVKIGENVQLLNAHIDWNHGFLITIGNNCKFRPTGVNISLETV